MLDAESGSSRRTLGADKNYDTKAFVVDCRKRKVTPHVAQKKHTTIDGRTTRHEVYEIRIKKRKQIEECFGWMKNIGLMHKFRHRGKKLADAEFSVMKQHAVIGYEVLNSGSSPLLKVAAEIAHTHHEKFDGSGYPRELKENEIPLFVSNSVQNIQIRFNRFCLRAAKHVSSRFLQ